MASPHPGPLHTLRQGPPPALVAPVLALAAVGAVVVIPLVALAAIPVVVTSLLVFGGVVVVGLSIWASIEALAALERWMERDPRFQR
jgi:hypothetical protein